MFLCKLRTPSCANYENFHVYLAYRRQTGNVVTRQTYDRAPRLTRPPTARISRGGYGTCDLGPFVLAYCGAPLRQVLYILYVNLLLHVLQTVYLCTLDI